MNTIILVNVRCLMSTGQEYVQKKNIIGTREFMSPEVLAGYIIENGEVDREAMMESDGVKYVLVDV